MITEVCALQKPEEVAMCIAAGADRFGVMVRNVRGTPDSVTFEQARAIFAAHPPSYPKLALTIETDLDAIEEMVRATNPDILHLCGDINLLPPEGVGALAKRLPGVKMQQAIPVAGPEALDLALAYEKFAHILLLDSVIEGELSIGATGAVHDWSISRKIVEKVSLPVILAGGLSAENVADAIRAVRPWGVDSNSLTNIPGTWYKDAERMRRFVEAARNVL